MRSLDLFSGIGGFALGFESAGIETAAFCEADIFCREWLAQQWPGVPIYPDVRTLDGRAVGYVDIVCGGFPCTDISVAGRGEGLDGKHSGLWFEMRRIVREVRPAWVVIENVPRLRTLGADRIYSDMEEAGYTGWFFVVGADDVGAPHRRKRAWGIFRRMADADRDALRLIEQRFAGGWTRDVCDGGQAEPRNDGSGRVGDTDGVPGDSGQREPLGRPQRRTAAHGSGDGGRSTWNVADAHGEAGRRRDGPSNAERGDGRGSIRPGETEPRRCGGAMADTEGRGLRADGRASGQGGHADVGDASLANAARHGDDGRPARQRVVDGGSGGRGDLDERALGETCGPVADGDGGGQQGSGVEDNGELGGSPWDFVDGRSRAWFEHRRHGEPGVGNASCSRGTPGLPASTRGDGQPAEPAVAHDRGVGQRWPAAPGERQHEWEAPRTTSDAECELGAAVDGLPGYMGPTLNKARLKAAGNTVVPVIPAVIGRILVRLGA